MHQAKNPWLYPWVSSLAVASVLAGILALGKASSVSRGACLGKAFAVGGH